jgi:GTP-binding protein
MSILIKLRAIPRKPLICDNANPWVLSSRNIYTTPERKPMSGAEPKSRDYIRLSNSALSSHWDTLPPNEAQLAHAEKYFGKQPPKFLWSAPKFHSMAFGDSPEVCFLGRSNVGKSSLLNALLGRKIAETSSKPGRTQMMNAFAVGNDENNGKNRLVVLDMPGYGKGGRAEWGKEIMKYLSQRKQMKRAFLLIDSTHGIKTSDEKLLAMFREQNIPHQIVLSKVDKLLFPKARLPSEAALEARLSDLRRTIEDCRRITQPDPEDMTGALGEIISCSSDKQINGKKIGINAVRHAMMQAVGLELKMERKRIKPVEIVPHDVLFREDSGVLPSPVSSTPEIISFEDIPGYSN